MTQRPLPPKFRLGMLWRTLRVMFAPPSEYTFPALKAAHLPRMRGRVEILRDHHGIPHIYADEDPDLFASLGYLQGEYRFVTIDIHRHLGAGNLCELLGNFRMPRSSEMFPGKSIGDIDGFVRPLDFAAQCEADFRRLSARGQACLRAFADGINAALEAMNGVYPPEYLLFGSVRPWRPALRSLPTIRTFPSCPCRPSGSTPTSTARRTACRAA